MHSLILSCVHKLFVIFLCNWIGCKRNLHITSKDTAGDFTEYNQFVLSGHLAPFWLSAGYQWLMTYYNYVLCNVSMSYVSRGQCTLCNHTLCPLHKTKDLFIQPVIQQFVSEGATQRRGSKVESIVYSTMVVINISQHDIWTVFGHMGRNRFCKDLEAVRQIENIWNNTSICFHIRVTISLNEFECWSGPVSTHSSNMHSWGGPQGHLLILLAIHSSPWYSLEKHRCGSNSDANLGDSPFPGEPTAGLYLPLMFS